MCRKEDVEIESKRSCTVGLHRSRRLLWVSCAALRSGSQTHAPPSRWTVIRGNRSCNLPKPRVASAKIPDALQLPRPKKKAGSQRKSCPHICLPYCCPLCRSSASLSTLPSAKAAAAPRRITHRGPRVSMRPSLHRSR